MRVAADSEDASIKNVAMENRLTPMRELLAELLLEHGKPGEALREYEAALREYPNRYRGLYGAARAAEASGQREKTADYYKRLAALTKNADSARPEIAVAKAHLAAR
jgi:tetratricopeptide (TPR) repeat protein